jgi:predicted GH43/DUF377 family glycosyl hydrolase
MPDLAERFPENPILSPADIAPSQPGLKVQCLLNPGAFRFAGRVWLLLRVAERPEQKPGRTSFPIMEDGVIRIREFSNQDPRLRLDDPRVVAFDGTDYLTTLSHLCLVSSEDGVHFREEPSYPLLVGMGEQESYGIEDCRVTQMGSCYYLTYTAVSPHGVAVGLRSTQDWRAVTRHGLILAPHNKDCALFEEPIGGKYFALHRPSSPELGGNYIWVAESPDRTHWGNHRCLAHTRPGRWDSARVGAGASPIKTSEGWLEIYHGADADHRYCLGALLLDLEKPWKVLARSEEPILQPTAAYELEGFFGKVVFTNGHLVDGDQLVVYYGAADNVICGARFSLNRILRTLK